MVEREYRKRTPPVAGVSHAVRFMHPGALKVIIGAGQQRWEGWVATQRDELDLADADSWARFFGERRADALLCEHVLEHLTPEDAKRAARNAFAYLKPGGFIRVAVPDRHFPDEAYQKIVRVGGPGPADHPAADHKVVFGYRELAEIFAQAGFSVDLLEYHDEEGRFHGNEWEPEDAPVFRSSKLDPRNRGGTMAFPSIIIDAIRPGVDLVSRNQHEP